MKDLSNSKQLKAQIVFANESQDEETFHQKDLIRLFPYGLSMATETSRPLLLMKDEAHQYTLPVAVSPIEAGVALSQSNKSIPSSSPHKFSEVLLQALHMEIKQAVFVEIRGAHQYMRLYLTGQRDLNSVKLRADEAMSLCLHLSVPIYATKSFIGRSRVMNAEIENGQSPQIMQGFGVEKPEYLN